MAGWENPIWDCIEAQESTTENADTQLQQIEEAMNNLGEKMIGAENVIQWLESNEIVLEKDTQERLIGAIVMLSQDNLSDSFPSIREVLWLEYTPDDVEKARHQQAELHFLIANDPIIKWYASSYSVLRRAKYSNEQIEWQAAQDLAQCLEDATSTEEAANEFWWKYANSERAQDFRNAFWDGEWYTDLEIEEWAYYAHWVKESWDFNLDTKWEQENFLKMMKAIIDYLRNSWAENPLTHQSPIDNESIYDVFPWIDLN